MRSGLEAAVATMFTEPANNGRRPIAMRMAPMFCNNSPPSAAERKNGGTVRKRKSMFVFCIEADHTGLPAVNGMMWYAAAKISARGTHPFKTLSANQTVWVESRTSPKKARNMLIIFATKASTRNQVVGDRSSCSLSPMVMKTLMRSAM